MGDGISIEAFDTSGIFTVRITLETGDSIPLSPDSMVSEAVTSTSNIPATGGSLMLSLPGSGDPRFATIICVAPRLKTEFSGVISVLHLFASLSPFPLLVASNEEGAISKSTFTVVSGFVIRL